jgi:hypothetical protein
MSVSADLQDAVNPLLLKGYMAAALLGPAFDQDVVRMLAAKMYELRDGMPESLRRSNRATCAFIESACDFRAAYAELIAAAAEFKAKEGGPARG